MPEQPTHPFISYTVHVTVEYHPALGSPPAIELRVGGTGQALPGPTAPAPAPETVARQPTDAPTPVAAAAVAWRASPEARAAFYPKAKDEGQHDIWKREMALAFWRFLAGPETPLARQWFDLDGTAPERMPALFPLHTDLAAACRRLGFVRLATAALGFDERSLPTHALLPATFPAGGPYALFAGAEVQGVEVPALANAVKLEDLLRAFAGEHRAATAIEVERALAKVEETRRRWNEDAHGPYQAGTREQYEAIWALADGSADAAAWWTRPDLAACPPLVPLRLASDPRTATGAITPRRTPATGATLPEPPAALPPEPSPAPAAVKLPRTPATGAALPAAPSPASEEPASESAEPPPATPKNSA